MCIPSSPAARLQARYICTCCLDTGTVAGQPCPCCSPLERSSPMLAIDTLTPYLILALVLAVCECVHHHRS